MEANSPGDTIITIIDRNGNETEVFRKPESEYLKEHHEGRCGAFCDYCYREASVLPTHGPDLMSYLETAVLRTQGEPSAEEVRRAIKEEERE